MKKDNKARSALTDRLDWAETRSTNQQPRAYQMQPSLSGYTGEIHQS